MTEKRGIQGFWDASLQPLLRKGGLDVRRYRPPSPPTRKDQDAACFSALLRARETVDLKAVDDERAFLSLCARSISNSKAQRFQDVFALHEHGEKRGGFFVEFGATNGVDLSNTHLLEAHYGWTGLLAEPARCWHDALASNRIAKIDTRCVWNATGERLLFNEVSHPELSTIQAFSSSDGHADRRTDGNVYEVETVTLNDLLSQAGAPHTIDYMSVDTEGSELALLSAFDFNAYDIRVLTVEHNHTDSREKILALLTSHGFQRKFTEFSEWDDWYVKP